MDNHPDITTEVSQAQNRLLEAQLVPAVDLFSEILPPRVHGIYAWWMEPDAVPGLTGMPHPNTPLELLYVGIASRTSSSLYARLGTHATKTSRRSTLRLSLASLLAPSTGWTAATVSGRPVLNPKFEPDLTRFMQKFLSVSWIPHERPANVEEGLIERLLPPLNLDGNSTHRSYPYVKAARSAFRNSLS